MALHTGNLGNTLQTHFGSFYSNNWLCMVDEMVMKVLNYLSWVKKALEYCDLVLIMLPYYSNDVHSIVIFGRGTEKLFILKLKRGLQCPWIERKLCLALEHIFKWSFLSSNTADRSTKTEHIPGHCKITWYCIPSLSNDNASGSGAIGFLNYVILNFNLATLHILLLGTVSAAKTNSPVLCKCLHKLMCTDCVCCGWFGHWRIGLATLLGRRVARISTPCPVCLDGIWA